MSSLPTMPALNEPRPVLGVLAEFNQVDKLLAAAKRVRDAGYTRWDCHTPFPVHGLNDAMGLRPTRLPYFVLLCGLAGLVLALLMQWWMNAVDYPYIISGKPLFSLPANIPVVFELTVLLSAFGAFFGMLLFNGLPRFHHSVFYSERFKRASNDRFYLSIEASDPRFELAQTKRLLTALNPTHVEELIE